ncbi:alcohol dehydrogenase [Salmonella enterica subsp. enterica]|uniref:Alcohol dehydrogenase n=1 Tax=Salmonella enterica I TaxID=59201 RepID=A0A3S4J4R3_SALET|nr:alcohol dehydrogenase [Salmonella enterica subsp. enterica]
MKVKAVFINKPGEVETRWVDYPHKKENEVLIKVDAARHLRIGYRGFSWNEPTGYLPKNYWA